MQIDKLINLGAAYYAFDSEDQLKKYRQEDEKNGKTFLYGSQNRIKFRNSLTLNLAETKKALDNIKDILSVEGLDAVFVGPSDLGLSLGYAPGDHEEPVLIEAIEKTLINAKSSGKRAGIYTLSTDYARRMINLGFDYVVISSDARMLTERASMILAELNTK